MPPDCHILGPMRRAAPALAAIALMSAALLLAPAGASAYRLRMFHIPGGNIGCALIYGKEARGGEARCDIAEHSWKPPPKPRWCELDWGSGMSIGARSRAQFVCAGDTVLHQGRVLATGRSLRLGPYRCKSLHEAVRCLNLRTGHGFLLSRTAARRINAG